MFHDVVVFVTSRPPPLDRPSFPAVPNHAIGAVRPPTATRLLTPPVSCGCSSCLLSRGSVTPLLLCGCVRFRGKPAICQGLYGEEPLSVVRACVRPTACQVHDGGYRRKHDRSWRGMWHMGSVFRWAACVSRSRWFHGSHSPRRLTLGFHPSARVDESVAFCLARSHWGISGGTRVALCVFFSCGRARFVHGVSSLSNWHPRRFGSELSMKQTCRVSPAR